MSLESAGEGDTMADRVVAGWLTGIGQTFEGLSEAVIPTFGEVCQAPLAPRLSHQLACELRLSCPQRAAARSPGQGPHRCCCVSAPVTGPVHIPGCPVVSSGDTLTRCGLRREVIGVTYMRCAPLYSPNCV